MDKNKYHRIKSAGASFEKGIYHLYVLKNARPYDAYDYVLRIYQCAYLLGVANLLLDFNRVPLDPDTSERVRIDPATAIKHFMIRKWNGFIDEHPLHDVSNRIRDLYGNVVDARDNMIYRPYFKSLGNEWFWEDCELKELLKKIPEINSLEEVYRDFYQAVNNWYEHRDSFNGGEDIIYFLISIRRQFSNSQLTLLAAYTKLLNPDNPELMKSISVYRNQLLGVEIDY